MNPKLLIIYLLTPIFLLAASFDLQFNQEDWNIFQNLTEKDQKILKNYKNLFLKRAQQLSLLETNKKIIPSTVHFIWIGPKNFPETSLKNIESWIKFHPNFTFKFWTDRKRTSLPKNLHIEFIDEKQLTFFKKEFLESDNFAEKSDLLRYEILFKEGGIYVDHDVECFQSFLNLIHYFQFFCGIEPPHIPVGDSMITACNNLIGSIANHPLLEKTIETVKNNWTPTKNLYEGENSPEKKIKKIFHSTFLPFSDTILHNVSSLDYINIVLPPIYFNNIAGKKALFAHHQYASTWFENETKFEKTIRDRLVKITKKNNLILLVSAIFFCINLLLFILFFIFLKRLKKSILSHGQKNS